MGLKTGFKNIRGGENLNVSVSLFQNLGLTVVNAQSSFFVFNWECGEESGNSSDLRGLEEEFREVTWSHTLQCLKNKSLNKSCTSLVTSEERIILGRYCFCPWL